LNALLDEAEVLPTSGSRGCTATVVELRFNQDLANPPEGGGADKKIFAYKGKVEFIRPQDWEAELRVLIDECSTQESKTIYAHPPNPQSAPDASAAWAKINQVYGAGTMEKYKGERKDVVIERLLRDQRINNILRPKEGEEYNAVLVNEGEVDAIKAKMLLVDFEKRNLRMRRLVKRWANSFRQKINDYVYRKGNGKEPQTWPLIRCVTLNGPWNVLATGACLVDLPGIRDANAARARVAERYLQNCNQIWVVAPIKRAVDDGTAKDLMGEQFKRRLLMDGQYGNVSFICTQTDECEPTEIMRDHQDVASSKPGRWETMTKLLGNINRVEQELADMMEEEEDAVSHQDDLSAGDKNNDEDIDDDDALSVARQRVARARLTSKSKRWQRDLKAICATVRNEYSTRCLEDDFINGLKDLDQNENSGAGSGNQSNIDLLESIDLPVFCLSANDYLKIRGIKPSTDGPPNTFSAVNDTQVPALRSFVRDTTSKHLKSFYEMFANHVSDIVDRIKLIAIGNGNHGCTRTSRLCRESFEKDMLHLEKGVKAIVDDFRRIARDKVSTTLQPALEAGAARGQAKALLIAHSWGSSNRRSRNVPRSRHNNGLHGMTYGATCRRDGTYVSSSAGAIDLNQELCDPVEKKFSAAWQVSMMQWLGFVA
jgi:hypothetical protein